MAASAMAGWSCYDVLDGVKVPKLGQERWQQLKNLPLREDDVFIVTYPKSGTTWAQQIVRLLRNGGREDDQRLDLAVPWIEVLGSFWSAETDPHVDLDRLLPPRSFKSHLPYALVPGGLPHTTCAKYIYIARNPKDVCVSFWMQNKRKIDPHVRLPWEQFFDAFVDGSVNYGSWFDHVLEWWKHKNEKNILFLMYEDMKKDPQRNIQAIAELIGVDGVVGELLEEIVTKSSFSSMSENPTTNFRWEVGVKFSHEGAFMRKGVVGDWKNYFSSMQSNELDRLYEEKIRGNGLEFDFGD